MEFARFDERPIIVAIAGPDEKLESRYPRILENLRRAVRQLPHVLVFDHQDMSSSFRRVAVFHGGDLAESAKPIPEWLTPALP